MSYFQFLVFFHVCFVLVGRARLKLKHFLTKRPSMEEIKRKGIIKGLIVLVCNIESHLPTAINYIRPLLCESQLSEPCLVSLDHMWQSGVGHM
jgi:hypothetical protein